MTINFENIKERLKEMFPHQYKTDIENYIESKHPKTAADVEHYMRQWTYSNQKY
jgi:glycerophosphoryl diester phosphodiesterase